jgi:hypothetical protein
MVRTEQVSEGVRGVGDIVHPDSAVAVVERHHRGGG